MLHPLLTLSKALERALSLDLPDVEYSVRNYKAENEAILAGKIKENEIAQIPRILKTRRPYDDEVTVTMFVQSWSDTSIGFGGVAGQGFTSAYTVIVSDDIHYAVYFGGRFAYMVDISKASAKGQENFRSDIVNQRMVEVRSRSRYN